MSARVMVFLPLLLVGCGYTSLAPDPRDTSLGRPDTEESGETGDSDSKDSDSDSADTEIETGDSTPDTDETGKETGDTEKKDTEDTDPKIWWDCDKVPDGAISDTNILGARGYHGLSFDDEGNILGWDGRQFIMKSPYDGAAVPWVPGFNTAEGMDRLPDGDWVISDTLNQRLVRVTPEGGAETLTSISGVYGVTVGPDGMIYACNGGIVRVDPETGDQTEIIPSPGVWTARVVDFSLDSSRMYIATLGYGDVYYLELDENLDPLDRPERYASGVGSGWHDGIGVDACGYVYVAEYYSAGLYRIAPDGTVTSVVTPGTTRYYGHGLQWGSGIGGWRQDALYQPQPYNGNTVREVVIGFPSGDLVRIWKGVKTP